MRIEELIVVEGKNDAHAIRRALGNVDILWTEGFGLTDKKIDYLRQMALRRGVIVCTDPDFAGKTIRDKIARNVPGIKHVYLSRKAAINPQNNDIGVENASMEEIRKAFLKAAVYEDKGKCSENNEIEYTMEDLVEVKLVGCNGAMSRRNMVGAVLGIGDTNAKQFLHRLNRFGISRKDFLEAIKAGEENNE